MPFPVPSAVFSGNAGSINLNDVMAAQTYYYEFKVATGCSSSWSSWHTGSFSTYGIGTDNIVGFVSGQANTPNPDVLIQNGGALSGADLDLYAVCFTNASDPTATRVFWFNTTGSMYPWRTDSHGYFNASMAVDTTVYGGNYWDMGNGHQVFFYLGWGGCVTWEVVNGNPIYATYFQSTFNLTASAGPGGWSENRSVPSMPTESTGYVPYVLNDSSAPGAWAVAAVAFVHTSSADCAPTITGGSSQTINSYNGGNGANYVWNNISQIGPADVHWGQGGEIKLEYRFAGTVQQQLGNPYISTAWAAGYLGAAGLSNATVPEWLSDTSFNYGTPASGYLVFEVGTGYSSSNPYPYSWTSSATYSSTAGTDITLDESTEIGVDIAGAVIGESFGESVPVTDTTTDSYTAQSTLSCSFYDPSTTQTAVFYYTFGDITTTFQPVIHVWLAGYCPVNHQTC
ncbi:MAG: hypothetical protein ABSB90_01475 [Thermoplasmata archaeon]|jgi:hypothetical protein